MCEREIGARRTAAPRGKLAPLEGQHLPASADYYLIGNGLKSLTTLFFKKHNLLVFFFNVYISF